jgi:hypothetical protein
MERKKGNNILLFLRAPADGGEKSGIYCPYFFWKNQNK